MSLPPYRHGAAAIARPPAQRAASCHRVALVQELTRLHERHAGEIWNLCRALVRDPEDASDAFQSAWAKACAALERSEQPIRDFRTWLLQIARNACFDELRRRARERRGSLAPEPVSPCSPEETCLRRQRMESVFADVKALPPRQREAIVLRELGGLDHASIAGRLGVSPENSRFLVAAARRNLRRGRTQPDQPSLTTPLQEAA